MSNAYCEFLKAYAASHENCTIFVPPYQRLVYVCSYGGYGGNAKEAAKYVSLLVFTNLEFEIALTQIELWPSMMSSA